MVYAQYIVKVTQDIRVISISLLAIAWVKFAALRYLKYLFIFQPDHTSSARMYV